MVNPLDTTVGEPTALLVRQGSLKAKVEEREAQNPQIGYKAAMELALQEKIQKEAKDKKKAEKRRETLK